jgi:hypothetical protein
MFKKHSFQVKVVKDTPNEDAEPTVLDAIRGMTPEELEQLNKKIMRQAAINIGAIVLVKVSVPIILAVIAKRLEPKS